MRTTPTDYVHHAYIPDMLNGEPNTTATRRDCKMSDPTDAESLERGEVDCPKCLDHLRACDEQVWRIEQAQKMLADLEGTGGVDGQAEGYGVWHERAGSLCMAVTESIQCPAGRLPVSWYLKITAIPERFNNHGFFVAVNYGLDGGVNHAAHDEWMPADADVWHALNIIHRAQRTIKTAILFGLRQTAEGNAHLFEKKVIKATPKKATA